MTPPRSIFVGITGASGFEFGASFVYLLSEIKPSIELNTVVSNGALSVSQYEGKGVSQTDIKHRIHEKSTYFYEDTNLAAGPASGSFGIDAAVILPCSMNTLSKISVGISDSLITRAVDVLLKEGRKVVLCTRETPLNRGHLNNMLSAHDKGCTIMPIQHAFYTDSTMKDHESYKTFMIRNFVGRVLDQLNIQNGFVRRWS